MNLPDWEDANYQAVAPLIDTAAAANGIRPSLAYALVSQESRFNPNAVGDNGNAHGLTQIWLPTAQGVGYTGSADGLNDPATSLQYGFAFLARLLQSNSEVDALSRYNSGYAASQSSAGAAYAASVEVRAQYFDQLFGVSPPAPLT